MYYSAHLQWIKLFNVTIGGTGNNTLTNAGGACYILDGKPPYNGYFLNYYKKEWKYAETPYDYQRVNKCIGEHES